MTPLCSETALERTGAAGLRLADGREIVIVGPMSHPRAYVNSCPHQAMPLETFPDRFLNEDRTLLICSTHGARFRVTDGHCVSGPCKGKALAPVRVIAADGMIYLDGT